jgi:hypothetical protein
MRRKSSELERHHEEACADFESACINYRRLRSEGMTEQDAETQGGDMAAFDRLWDLEESILRSLDSAAITAVLIRRHESGLLIIGEVATAMGLSR